MMIKDKDKYWKRIDIVKYDILFIAKNIIDIFM